MKRYPIAVGVLLVGLVGSSVSIWYVRAEDTKAAPAAAVKTKTLAETTAVLQHPCGLNQKLTDVTVEELFDTLEKNHGVLFRLDPVSFNKHSGHADILEHKFPTILVKGLTVSDLLQAVCADLGGSDDGQKLGFRVKAGQIIIGRAHVPATTPGQYKAGPVQTLIPEDAIMALLVGPTVSIAVENQTLAEVVHQLREQTGANIIFDPRIAAAGDKKLTLTFNDAKLMTVLKLAALLCDVGVAVVDNAYIVTDPGLAAQLMTETELNVFGKPAELNLFGKPPAKQKK
ncbi:hypothetical protein BH11PLA2_BH11PLA2_05560 [soil metagenome]